MAKSYQQKLSEIRRRAFELYVVEGNTFPEATVIMEKEGWISPKTKGPPSEEAVGHMVKEHCRIEGLPYPAYRHRKKTLKAVLVSEIDPPKDLVLKSAVLSIMRTELSVEDKAKVVAALFDAMAS